jgi:hypothetical protein
MYQRLREFFRSATVQTLGAFEVTIHSYHPSLYVLPVCACPTTLQCALCAASHCKRISAVQVTSSIGSPSETEYSILRR